MGEYVPVLVSVYHRLYTLMRCIEALRNNAEASQTDLFVVSDAAATQKDEVRVAEVRKYIGEIRGFKSVTLIARPENWGANKSVMDAIEQLLKRYGRLIFMEDDILPGRYYLEFMNKGLKVYMNNQKVFAICGNKIKFRLPKSCKADMFVLPRYSAWGVGLWADKFFAVDFKEKNRYAELQARRPDLFNFYKKQDPLFLEILKADSEGRIKAADVRIGNYLLYSDQVCIYPRQTMTNVIDSYGDAMHGGFGWKEQEKLIDLPLVNFVNIPLEVDSKIYRRYLNARYPSLLHRFSFISRHYGLKFAIKYYANRILHRKPPAHEKVGNE